jgi:hypothetical protein
MKLVRYIANQTLPPLLLDEAPDKAIADILLSYHEPVTTIPFKGIIKPKTRRKLVMLKEILGTWDFYKDSLLNYEDPEEVAVVEASPAKVGVGRPRLLVGIFTTDSLKEKRRRDLIRTTYLRFYVNTTTPKLICALQEILNNSLANEEDCQMAYTFVIGGNPSGTTELMEFNDTYPITLNGQSLENSTDRYDTVYLNIRENMNDGKSQTWFRYATMVLENHYFDYIGKMDTDTLLFPDNFLNNTFDRLPSFPNNARTYGGTFELSVRVMKQQTAPAYMTGPLYWMSPDLARYITSSRCNRSAMFIHSEDKAIGTLVHSHPLPIRQIQAAKHSFAHPIKKLDSFRSYWKEYCMFNASQRQKGGAQTRTK